MGARKRSKRRRSYSPEHLPRDKTPVGALMKIGKFFLVLGVWGFIAVAALVAWYAAELPGIIDNPNFERKYAVTVKDHYGNEIARYGELRGLSVSVEDLPPHLIYAVMAIEDRRFYNHFGLDPIGLARAILANITQGGVVQGGSTITQQLAKNLFLTPERTYKRKVQEAILAVWLETQLTKDEIMSAYLNRVYLGSGAYGVEAAAKVYFKKPASKLTLRESATIAGLLKAPSRYSPENNPGLSSKRTNVVIAAMRDAGYITEAEEKANSDLAPIPQEKPGEGDADRYFSDWVVSDLSALTGELPSDMIVETTMIPSIQKAAESAIARVLREEGAEKNASQAAVVVMDTDGAVLAMVGGKDYALSQFNRAADALRPPGSSFKPVVYLAALNKGWGPQDLIEDAPIKIGRYRPENFKREYYGEVPLEFALAKSLNTAAVRLAQIVGIGEVIRMSRSLGIQSELQRDLSLSLGSSGVPVVEMATAYASIARGGYVVVPYAITSVKDQQGRLVYQRAPFANERRVASERAISDLIYMMRGVVDYGTGQGAKIGMPVAGKTGTSQDFRDAWFIGFAGNIVCAVWVGNDDNSPMKNITGGSLPTRIWRDVMNEAIKVANEKKGFTPLFPASANTNGEFDSLVERLLSAPVSPPQDR